MTDPEALAQACLKAVADSKGEAVGAAAPYWLNFFQKSAFFCAKGIHSVVCICDK